MMSISAGCVATYTMPDEKAQDRESYKKAIRLKKKPYGDGKKTLTYYQEILKKRGIKKNKVWTKGMNKI